MLQHPPLFSGPLGYSSALPLRIALLPAQTPIMHASQESPVLRHECIRNYKGCVLGLVGEGSSDEYRVTFPA